MLMTVVPPARVPPYTPGSGRSLLTPRRLASHRPTSAGSSVEAVNSASLAVDGEHVPHLEVAGVTAGAVPAACSAAACRPAVAGCRRRVGRPDDLRRWAVQAGHAHHDVDPAGVGVGADHLGLPGRRVDGEQPQLALVPALHYQQRRAAARRRR